MIKTHALLFDLSHIFACILVGKSHGMVTDIRKVSGVHLFLFMQFSLIMFCYNLLLHFQLKTLQGQVHSFVLPMLIVCYLIGIMLDPRAQKSVKKTRISCHHCGPQCLP